MPQIVAIKTTFLFHKVEDIHKNSLTYVYTGISWRKNLDTNVSFFIFLGDDENVAMKLKEKLNVERII